MPDRYLSNQVMLELGLLQSELEDLLSMHFARFGLSSPKFAVLIHLYMTGDQGLIQSELSKKMLVSRANITGLIERLERDGLVVRRNDPSDKRVFRVCPTDKAVILMNAFLPLHNDYLSKIMSPLDKGEKEVLISLFKKLRKGLEAD